MDCFIGGYKTFTKFTGCFSELNQIYVIINNIVVTFYWNFKIQRQADCNGSDNELSEQSYVQSRSMRDRPVRHFARCYSLGFWAKFQIQYKMSTTDTYHEGRVHEFYCQFKFSGQGQVYKLLALACLTSFPELKVAW